ncbi:hypothetical protein ABBQ32_000912 [Trebouxia sp. C0010 RCD-2024]
MKPLVDLTSRALARMIEGKSAEEIRETFHLPDDLTEEEKLEPVKNATADPRIRLLNRLYAKKRKELAHKKAAELAAEARARKQALPPNDDRPLEDLLSFIGTEPASGKAKSKQKKKRGKKKNGMLQAADSVEACDAEARPSSDALPAVNSVGDASQSSNSCWSPQAHCTCASDHISNAVVEAKSLQSLPATPASSHKPSGRHPHSATQNVPAKQDETSLCEALQLAQAKDMALQELQEAKLDQLSKGDTNEAGSESWRQANGHSPQGSSPDRSVSMDKEDAALLADMQGFACALGCDWQVRGHDMRSLGTLPLPGAQITTLTSLANFKPSHAISPQIAEGYGNDSSCASDDEGSEQSELDTDDELEAAYEDRQAANLREANVAFDHAMSQAAFEDHQPSIRPRWPDDPSHASLASLDDWATNGLHQNGASSTLTSHGSFSFKSACPEVHTVSGHDQHTPTLPMSWPHQSGSSIEDSIDGLHVDVSAIQQVFQQFLQRAGLDEHLEIRATGAINASSLQCRRNVAVQNVLPCGSFMKIQLN